jgi:hypothetical protein
VIVYRSSVSVGVAVWPEGPCHVGETPGSVEVHQSKEQLVVTCAKPGHLDAVERVESSLRGRSDDPPEQRVLMAGSGAALAIPWAAPQVTLLAAAVSPAAAPLLIGLLLATPVTVAVDYGSGAMFRYPSAIVLIMPPAEFPGEDTRNACFADLERRFDAALQQRRQENDSYCRTASKFELVAWKCERLRKQEATLPAERRQWLAAERAGTEVLAVPTRSP